MDKITNMVENLPAPKAPAPRHVPKDKSASVYDRSTSGPGGNVLHTVVHLEYCRHWLHWLV